MMYGAFNAICISSVWYCRALSVYFCMKMKLPTTPLFSQVLEALPDMRTQP
jgi:hypothetical protein